MATSLDFLPSSLDSHPLSLDFLPSSLDSLPPSLDSYSGEFTLKNHVNSRGLVKPPLFLPLASFAVVVVFQTRSNSVVGTCALTGLPTSLEL